MLPALEGWFVMTAIKNLVTLLVIALLGSGVLGWFLFQTRTDNDALRAQLARLEGEHTEALKQRDEQMQRALENQAAKHQQAIDTINAEHDKAVTAMRQGERQRLAAAAKEFDNIFEGNKATLGYLNSLEDKVKAGQTLAKAEVERLTIITTGLGYLKKQYQKPMQEFKELQDYFEAQAAKVTAKPKGNFFKRLFSKEFREAEKEYERSEGARQAFEQAQGVFIQVYSKAQKAMGNVSLDADAQIKKLQDYLDEKKQQNPEDLSALFSQARKALRTHQEVLDFEPEPGPAPSNKPQP
jgi:type II secretory pathway pseudopilin PulG